MVLPWCTLALAVVFGATVVWNFSLFSGNVGAWIGGAAALSVVPNVLAFAATGVAAVQLFGALPRIRPPEIAHRLTEALKYLA